MNNNELIQQARELCGKATPGPWKSLHGIPNPSVCQDPYWDKEIAVVNGSKDYGGWRYHQAIADADLMAASRILVPRLCDALEAAEAENRWIPVSERLPEPETNVLICQHYHEDAPYAKITIGHLHQDRDLRHKPYWNWIAHGADMVHPKIEAYHRAEFICPGKEFVTHWRPLPQPPQKG